WRSPPRTRRRSMEATRQSCWDCELAQPYLSLHRLDKPGRVVADALFEDINHIANLGRRGDGIALDHHQVGRFSRRDAPILIVGTEDLGPVGGKDLDGLYRREPGLQ